MENILQNVSLNNNKLSNEEPLYVMTIELEEGNCSEIKIYLDSKPEELAFEFCKENNLDFNSMNYLTNQIKVLVENFQNSLPKGGGEAIEEVEEENISKDNINSISSNKKRTPFTSPITSDNKIIEDIPLSNQNDKIFKKHTIENFTKEKHTLFSYTTFFNNIREKIAAKNKPKKKFIKKKKRNNSGIKHFHTKNNSISLISNSTYSNFKTFINNYNYSKNRTQTSKEKTSVTTMPAEEKERVIKSLLNKSSESSNKKKLNRYKTEVQKETVTNFGERLYEKGRKIDEVESQKINQLKENLKKNEQEKFSFHPVINRNTDLILKNAKHQRSRTTTDTFIYDYKNIIDNRIEKLKKKFPDKDEKELTFSPVVCKKSIHLDKKRKLSPNQRINVLYSSKKAAAKKLEKIESEMYANCSFAPSLKTEYNCNFNNLSFQERQNVYKSRSQEKMNRLVEERNEEVSGDLFHPRLYTCSSFSNLKRRTRNIFKTLYSYAEKYKFNRCRSRDNIITYENERRKLRMNPSSEKILSQKRYNVFEKIFHLLDRDLDDQISILNIDLNKLPTTIIQIIKPIIDKMKKENNQLTKEKFIMWFEELFPYLSVKDKQVLYSFNNQYKINNYNTNFTFHPKINKNSERILSRSVTLSNSNSCGRYDDMKENDSYVKYLRAVSSTNSVSQCI